MQTPLVIFWWFRPQYKRCKSMFSCVCLRSELLCWCHVPEKLSNKGWCFLKIKRVTELKVQKTFNFLILVYTHRREGFWRSLTLLSSRDVWGYVRLCQKTPLLCVKFYCFVKTAPAFCHNFPSVLSGTAPAFPQRLGNCASVPVVQAAGWQFLRGKPI